MKGLRVSLLWLILGVIVAPDVGRANVALLLEEPFGTFGGMNPTGHASVYLSNVCAASLVSVRRCAAGEQGVVISRYHRIGGYDWLAIPLIPYLYAVNQADQVPSKVNSEQVASLRDAYRRQYLEEVAPDGPDERTPRGDWIQLVGAAYDRTIYSFELETTQAQDDRLILAFNDRSNRNHFNLLFHNCADFARQIIDFYYPKAIHRNFTADVGIMTPKQAAKCLVRYAKRHPNFQFSSFALAQVPGTVPRSGAVRGVLESLVKSKRYALPLTSLAVIQPYIGGGLAFAWVGGGHFNPRRVTQDSDRNAPPETFAEELESNRVARSVETPDYSPSRDK
jgi:hypothetical protein